MDDSAYRFACALLAAREVDRDVAEMICQEVREGRISLEQGIGALIGMAGDELAKGTYI